MFIVTAKVEAWEEDFPGSRVKWVVGQSREVHDSLVDKFRNNPAAWTVSGGSDSSPMQVTKTVTGLVEVSTGETFFISGQQYSYAELLQINPADYVLQKVRVFDVGVNGSEWVSNGYQWRPASPVILVNETVPVSKSDADTAWKDLLTFTIPRGLLGTNGTIIVEPDITFPSSATTKNIKVMFGSDTPYSKSRTTTSLEVPSVVITNKTEATQVFPLNGPSVRGSGVTATVPAGSTDTSNDVVLTVSASWGTAGLGSNNITMTKCVVKLEV